MLETTTIMLKPIAASFVTIVFIGYGGARDNNEGYEYQYGGSAYNGGEMGRQYGSESYQNSPGRAVVRESYGDRAIGGRVPVGREGMDGSPTNYGNYQNHVDETIANNNNGRGLPDAAEFAAL